MIKNYSDHPGMEPRATVRGYQRASERRDVIDSIYVSFMESTFILCHESEWGSQGGVGRDAVIYRQWDDGRIETFWRAIITHQFDRSRDSIELWNKTKINIAVEVELEEYMDRKIKSVRYENGLIISSFLGWKLSRRIVSSKIEVSLDERKNNSLLTIALQRRTEKGKGRLVLGIGDWGGWGYKVNYLRTKENFVADISSISRKDLEEIINGCGFGRIQLREEVRWW